MATADPTQLSLTEASALISSGELSPLELTDACIARSEALDPTLQAYITPTFESARQEAKAATDEIGAGRRRGPLQGIPFGLKDLYETAGLLTTAASPFRKDNVPTQDAHVVTLLKEAGAIFLGKLTMHEWALGATGINEVYPTSRNPWDIARITGGSSSGSAAAISAGLCIGSLGSDTRGSIRMPASFCGITGLKPTYGRVSLRGVVPLIWSLDHSGPMARTASDCALILQAIAGYDDDDPTSIEMPVPDYSASLKDGIKGLRIGVPTNFFFDAEAVVPEVSQAVKATLAVFTALGAAVKEVTFPSLEAFGVADPLLADAAAYHEEHLRENREAFSKVIGDRLADAAQELRAVDYSRTRFSQLEYKLALRKLFRDVDILVTPTEPILAPTIEKAAPLRPLIARNTGPFNVAGIPAITVPCGFGEGGLPIGLSLAGRAWEEETVLRAAHAYQSATDWHTRRPTLA